MALIEPGQIRQAIRFDMKQARHAILQSRTGSRGAALKRFTRDTVQERNRACSARGQSIRFLTPGSRDIETQILPRCYRNPKGKRP